MDLIVSDSLKGLIESSDLDNTRANHILKINESNFLNYKKVKFKKGSICIALEVDEEKLAYIFENRSKPGKLELNFDGKKFDFVYYKIIVNSIAFIKKANLHKIKISIQTCEKHND